jgi:L-fuconolactonase
MSPREADETRASPIVDAHHHLIDPDRFDYHFVKFLPELRRRIDTDVLGPLIRDAGVARTVCVQAHDSEEETVFMLEQASAVDWIAGVVGWVPLVDPVAAARTVEGHRSRATSLCGIRHLIHDEADDDWVVQSPVLESLGVLAENDLAFDLSAFKPRHIEHVMILAERVPDLDVVICHMGMPRTMEDEWEPWASIFARAAENRRCTVKISGMDMYLGGPDAGKTQRYIDFALQHFGPERMIWASNWPVSLRGEGYAELLETARVVTQSCSDDQRDAIFGGTANRVYRLGL